MPGSEAEEAAWELATAETLRARGELAEAANWYRRAANHLMEAGEDERAIAVAKLAAELAALDDAGRTGAQRSEPSAAPEPPAASPASPAQVAPWAADAARDSSTPTLPPAADAKGPPPRPAPAMSRPNAPPAGATTGRHKLPWQRSSHPPAPGAPPRQPPPPPPSAFATKSTAGASQTVSKAPPSAPRASARVAPPPPPPPSGVSDDAVTIQLDVAKLRETAAISAPDSPLAALVDQAVSDLERSERDNDEHTSEIVSPRGPAISPERIAEIDAIAARLPALPLFAEFSADDVRAIARQTSVMKFAPGENLTEAGAPEGPMYLLVEGEAFIGIAGDELRTQSLLAGDFVGEISALYGGPRMATVVAKVEVEAVALAPSLVRWMIHAMPSFAESVKEAIAERVRASIPHHAPMFRALDVAQRREAFAQFELVEVEAGDALLAEGDPADALFVVCAGEIELYGGRIGAARPVRGRMGEAAGIAALHGGEPAAGTVRAARRSLIARLDRSKYAAWIAKYPRIAQAVAAVGAPRRGGVC